MCSFLILLTELYKKQNLEQLNKLLKTRGPDNTNIYNYDKYTFIHNILHLCGSLTIQPIVKENIIVLFNGEIYNYKNFGDYCSDTECIIDLYIKYDINFVKQLDGEFSIVIFDFHKNCVVLSSDIFGTKPLFYGYENGFVISSIRKTIIDNKLVKHNAIINKLEPNTLLKLTLDNKIIEQIKIHEFNLKQIKDTFTDFNKALIDSILKRCKFNNENNNKIFIALSSGYDSGVLDCILEKNNIDFVSYSIEAKENLNILNKRLQNKKKEYKKIKLFDTEFNKNKDFVINNCDNYENIYFEYNKYNECNEYNECNDYNNNKKTIIYNPINDWASYGLSYIFNIAKNEGMRICLSGHGPDEIFSDYGFNGEKYNKCSEIGGKFPNKLKNIYPWQNFYKGVMQNFLSKEESIASLHSIETRYPFLDKNVVQEFLWLKPELKNKYYKSPLHNLLTENNYPFCPNEKIGFKCKKNLELNVYKYINKYILFRNFEIFKKRIITHCINNDANYKNKQIQLLNNIKKNTIIENFHI